MSKPTPSRKVDFERTLSNAEDVGSLMAEDFAREAAAITSAAYNLLDRHPIFGQSENDSIGFLAPEMAFVLDRFGGCEQIGIDFGRADRDADLAHGFAHRIEEGVAPARRARRAHRDERAGQVMDGLIREKAAWDQH